MYRVIGKFNSNDWFLKNQKILLFLANCPLTKWILNTKKPLKHLPKRKIDKISPASVHYKNGKKFIKDGKLWEEFEMVAFTRPEFAIGLTNSFGWAWQLFHLWDINFANKFVPALSMGCDTATYYAIATGDGSEDAAGSWNTAHDSLTGSPRQDRIEVQIYANGTPTYDILRGFAPIDTSGLPDTAVVSAATFSLFEKGFTNYDGDNDGKDYMALVQSFQPNADSLDGTEFDQCGDAVDNPTELSDTQIDITGRTSASENREWAWTLNATGIGIISKTGATKFGIREGHDTTDEATNASTNNAVYWKYSGDADHKPQLAVTYSTPTAYTADCTETLNLTASMTSLTQYRQTITDTLNMSDTESIKSTFLQTLVAVLNLTDSVSPKSAFKLTLSEILNLTAILSSAKDQIVNITDTLNLSDSMSGKTGFKQTLTETLNLTDALTAIQKYTVTINEILTLTDTLSAQGKFSVTILETLVLSDYLETLGRFWNWASKNTAVWAQATKGTTGSWVWQDKREP
jgi:hypothetical protein